MPDNNISKAQPSKAKGLGGVLTIRSKNAALLYMYRCEVLKYNNLRREDRETLLEKD